MALFSLVLFLLHYVPQYCSTDLPCPDPSTQFCDTFVCKAKKIGGMDCETDAECLSDDCINESMICKELIGFGEECSFDAVCETGYCFTDQYCPPNSGCLTCNATMPECGAGSHCSTCGSQPTPGGNIDYCMFNCDFRLCGRLCDADLCATNCFPDEAEE